MTETFSKSDGWLFTSLLSFHRRKLILYDLLRVGDFLNFALFTLDEINGGLSRLESGGLIEFKKGRIYYTVKGKLFYKNHKKLFEFCIEEQLRFSKLFSELPLNADVIMKDYFTSDEYDIAIKKMNI